MAGVDARQNLLTKRAEWQRLTALFEEISELPPPERAQRIKSHGLDDALREKLEQMLGTLEHTMSLLDTPIADRISLKEGWYADQWVGTELNGFKLDVLLHEGGIAGVFLASQNEPVHRQVVIKLMRPEAPSEYLDFFRFEQQTLARLSHPNIAAIHTVDKSDDGLSYIVMEYIEGRVLSQFCAENSLSIHERLDIFLQICDAISYSHQRGILHRDLKSSNILVRDFEGKSTPTVIDFGISSDLNEQIQWSDHGLMGTPEYMSPEHVLNQNNMDVRADVYSLGMVLFSLLVGRIPFDREHLNKLEHAKRLTLIAEFEVPVPSQHFDSLRPDERDLLAQERGTGSADLSKQLTRELDCIFLQATRKDRETRYASVAELAADVRRFLNHEVVQAHPSSVWYRGSKFFRRNLVASVATLIIVCLASVFMIKLVEQNARIKDEAANALYEKKNAEQVTAMIMQTIGFADPHSVARSGEASVAGMLDQGYRNLVNTRGLSDNVRAKLLLSLADAFRSVNDIPKTREIGRFIVSELEITDTETLCRLRAGLAETEYEDSKFDDALEMALQAREYCAVNAVNPELIAEASLTIAAAQLANSEFDQSADTLRAAVAMIEDTADMQTPILADLYHQLGRAEFFRVNHAESKAYYQKAEEIMSRYFSGTHARVVEIQLGQYQFMCVTGDAGCTSARGEDLRSRIRAVWGEDSRQETFLLMLITNLHMNNNDFVRAAQTITENLQIIERTDNQFGPHYVQSLIYLTISKLGQDDVRGALEASSRVYRHITEPNEMGHVFPARSIAFAELWRAEALFANGEFDVALELISSAITFFRELQQDKGLGLSVGLSLRATIYAELGEEEKALDDAQELIRVAQNNLDNGIGHPSLERSIALYVRLLSQWDAESFAQLETSWREYTADFGDLPFKYKHARIERFIAAKR